MKALIRIQWLNLLRDRGALALTYILPIGFFSIFAFVFGSSGKGVGSDEHALTVLCVDEDQSEGSERMLRAFDAQGGIDLELTREVEALDGAEATVENHTRESALRAVRSGKAPAAVLVPKGFGASFGSFTDGGARIELVYDAANPIAQHMLTGLLQAASFQAAPDLLLENGMQTLEQFGGGPMTPAQENTMEELRTILKSDSSGADDAAGGQAGGFTGLIEIESTAAQRKEDNSNSPNMVAYYAAAIGVMFLLFSMAGAAGSILEQEEFGTLERLLTSNLSMNQLLYGHWIFFAAVGVLQLVVMFAWGAVVFGLELLDPATLVGCGFMAVFTSAAAAAFGLMFAALCRSRAQLSGISTIVILTTSALGGSMMPKFITPFLETTSQFTFNGWALDGFLKVLWYRQPEDGVFDVLQSILPQLGVLLGTTVLFLAIARYAARRWEQI